MSTFDQDEASSSWNRPLEFYDIALSTGVTYRIASGPRDLQVGALLYTATPAARAELVVPDASGNGSKALQVSLPITHALVRRWFAYGVPPRQVLVTAWRRQERSGLSEQLWSGLVGSIQADGNVAKLNVPSRTINPLRRPLPTLSVSRACPFILYDAACKVDRAAFTVTTTALYVNGRTVRVDLGDLTRNGDWTESGELLDVVSGERLTIIAQRDLDPGISSVADLDMQTIIPELKTGAAIQVFAGCKKGIGVCQTRFANRRNFGGLASLPTVNPFIRTGRGIVASPGV